MGEWPLGPPSSILTWLIAFFPAALSSNRSVSPLLSLPLFPLSLGLSPMQSKRWAPFPCPANGRMAILYCQSKPHGVRNPQVWKCGLGGAKIKQSIRANFQHALLCETEANMKSSDADRNYEDPECFTLLFEYGRWSNDFSDIC